MSDTEHEHAESTAEVEQDTKLDTNLNVAELLRRVADELEEQNDSKALSQMGTARVKRLVQDLREARSLAHFNPRTDRVDEFVGGSYLREGE